MNILCKCCWCCFIINVDCKTFWTWTKCCKLLRHIAFSGPLGLQSSGVVVIVGVAMVVVVGIAKENKNEYNKIDTSMVSLLMRFLHSLYYTGNSYNFRLNIRGICNIAKFRSLTKIDFNVMHFVILCNFFWQKLQIRGSSDLLNSLLYPSSILALQVQGIRIWLFCKFFNSIGKFSRPKSIRGIFTA